MLHFLALLLIVQDVGLYRYWVLPILPIFKLCYVKWERDAIKEVSTRIRCIDKKTMLIKVCTRSPMDENNDRELFKVPHGICSSAEGGIYNSICDEARPTTHAVLFKL